MKLTEFLEITKKHFIYYPEIVDRFGISVNACVFLCFISWNTVPNTDGWREHSTEKIKKETGLSGKEQATARKQLVKTGLLEEHYARLQHTLKFKIIGKDFDLESSILENGHSPKGKMGTSQDGECPLAVEENGLKRFKERGKERGKEEITKEGSATRIAVSEQTQTPRSETEVKEEEPKMEIPSETSTVVKEKSKRSTFIESWSSEYEKANGEKYIFNGGRDGKAVKEMLASGVPIQTFIDTAKLAWKLTPSSYLRSRSSSIHGFFDVYNELRTEFGKSSNKNPLGIAY